MTRAIPPAFPLTLPLVLALASPALANDVFVAKGATWKYLDDGSDQGTAWQQPGFDDSGWASGPAQLGYGDGDEQTVVGFGPNANLKYPTTYFRTTFDVVDASGYLALDLSVLRDDGVVIYLNGTELDRQNMPAGAIDYLTHSNGVVGGPQEDIFYSTSVPPAALVTGTNTLAVEIHQRTWDSSDISFDMELVGVTVNKVTRGPFLQRASSDQITFRWKSATNSAGQVWLGPAPGQLTKACLDSTSTYDHVVRCTGLMPDTVYYYAVGTPVQVLAGNDADHWFRTAPAPGSSDPTRIWVIGDSGSADANAEAVRDAYYGYPGSDQTDVWLMLGDNAYNEGADEEYQTAVFDMYPEMLRRTPVWPTRGNHEKSALVYYTIFTNPTNGEAGGFPSGTEAYYSFDHANVHFICLDSYASIRAVGGPMWNWCQADLQSTDQDWIVAYWHHPPYSKGTHDSDTEQRLWEMRQNFLPLLESYGVDLVLSGHSHAYERSMLLDGHYGNSLSFSAPLYAKDSGDGDPAGDGAYTKTTGANQGAVYTVAGSSGKLGGGPLNHPAMKVSLNELGSLVIDVDDLRMDVRFLDDAGVVRDRFTLLTRDEAGLSADVSKLSASAGGTQTLTLAPGPGFANDIYAIVGSATGTHPGIPVGSAGLELPLVLDAWTLFTVKFANGALFGNTIGFLDGAGAATATIQLPAGVDPSLVGTVFWHAGEIITVIGQGTKTVYTTNPVPFSLVP